jgi:hypothetical protein
MDKKWDPKTVKELQRVYRPKYPGESIYSTTRNYHIDDMVEREIADLQDKMNGISNSIYRPTFTEKDRKRLYELLQIKNEQRLYELSNQQVKQMEKVVENTQKMADKKEQVIDQSVHNNVSIAGGTVNSPIVIGSSNTEIEQSSSIVDVILGILTKFWHWLIG